MLEGVNLEMECRNTARTEQWSYVLREDGYRDMMGEYVSKRLPGSWCAR